MVADHTAAQQELAALALARGIDLPPHLRDLPEETIPPSARNDPSFDLTYMRSQVLAHQKALELFSAEATKGGDHAIREFARAQVPALLAHLEHAYQIISRTQQHPDGGEM
jgi:putative membrane protein